MSLYETATFQKQEKSNPKSIFSIDHLYSRWRSDGSRDSSTELDLQIDHENTLQEFLGDLCSSISEGEFTSLSEQQILFCGKVSLRLVLRNPNFIDSILRTWRGRFVKKLFVMRFHLMPKAKLALKRSRLSLEEAARSEVRAYAATFGLDAFARGVLRERKVVLLVPAPGAPSFILGNQPTLLQRKDWIDDDSGVPKANAKPMEFYSVVDPRLMIAVVSKKSAEDLQFLDVEDMQRINGLIIKYCDEVVVRSSSDLEGAWYKVFDGEDHIRHWKALSKDAGIVRVRVRSGSNEVR